MNRDNIESKTFDIKAIDEVEGKVEAVFSVFNEIDSDGDVVMPDSIKSGYGDNGVAMVWAHDWKNPIGRGEIVSDDSKAVFKGQFIMDTQAGRDAFNTVKAMGDLQQWSFGYEVLDSESGSFQKDGQNTQARFLNDLKVWEVTVGVKEKSDDSVKEEAGLTLTNETDKLLIKLSALLRRIKELTSLRLKKEKTLSEPSTTLMQDLQDALQEAYQDIDTYLGVASAETLKEEESEEIDDTTLLLETNRVLMETLEEIED